MKKKRILCSIAVLSLLHASVYAMEAVHLEEIELEKQPEHQPITLQRTHSHQEHAREQQKMTPNLRVRIDQKTEPFTEIQSTDSKQKQAFQESQSETLTSEQKQVLEEELQHKDFSEIHHEKTPQDSRLLEEKQIAHLRNNITRYLHSSLIAGFEEKQMKSRSIIIKFFSKPHIFTPENIKAFQGIYNKLVSWDGVSEFSAEEKQEIELFLRKSISSYCARA